MKLSWRHIHIALILFGLAQAVAYGPTRVHASPPIEPWALLVAIVFPLTVLPGMLFIAGIANASHGKWQRIGLNNNPFNFRQPVHFFFFAATTTLPAATINLIATAFFSQQFVLDAAMGALFMLSALIACLLFQVVFRGFFEAEATEM